MYLVVTERLNWRLSTVIRIFKGELELRALAPEERYKQRQLQVKPVIEAFYDFLGSFIPMKGKLQTAVHYIQNQKQELMTFLKDGRLETSNNRAERAIKTAKEHGLNVYKYLTYLFEHLPNVEFLMKPELLEDFLPWAKKVQEHCKGI